MVLPPGARAGADVAALCRGQPGVFDAGARAMVVGGEGVTSGADMAKVQTNFSEPLHYNGERFSALAGKPLQLLGEISFSIHLTHWSHCSGNKRAARRFDAVQTCA